MDYQNKYSRSVAYFLNTKDFNFLEKEAKNGLKITQQDYCPLLIKSLLGGSLERIKTQSLYIIFNLNIYNPNLNPFLKTPLLASYFIAYNLKRDFVSFSSVKFDLISLFVENLAKQGSSFKMQEPDLKATIIALSSLLNEDTKKNINQFLQNYYLITENKDTFKLIFQKLSRLKEHHHMVQGLMPFIEKEKLEALFIDKESVIQKPLKKQKI